MTRDDRHATETGKEGAFRLGDPQRFWRNLSRALEDGVKAAAEFAELVAKNAPPLRSQEITDFLQQFADFTAALSRRPGELAEIHGRYIQGLLDLAEQAGQRLLGERPPPVITPEPGDRRFSDPHWNEGLYFDLTKQAYLLFARWAQEVVETAEGLDEKTHHRLVFLTNQMTAALSPSNFLFTNPLVLRETLATNGENLVRGMHKLVTDLAEAGGMFRIPQTDPRAFRVGRNLATTPGKVVFQNALIQLIQYAPSTPQVHKTPLLIVPPWINKFYILDLTPEKSFIKWAVDQGMTVFVISWVNPDASLRDKSFEDYMQEGLLAALGVVIRITGERRINTVGYCVGGTLLASTLAYMAAVGDERIKSATFLASQVDFSLAGDLKLFVDEAQLDALVELMDRYGYLDGSYMAAVFNLLRPRDLIWPYVVNNYLLGRTPIAFDILYWNSDSTRMTAANHAFYIREFYLRNRLAKGELVLGGQTLDLGLVKIPIYELATREDHISPAVSVFRGAQLFGGPVTFTLSGSGHIAGVINPPTKEKYGYWTDGKPEGSLEDWLAKARRHPGSWWPHWMRWLKRRAGGKVSARPPGSADFPPLEDAPGSYVLVRDEFFPGRS